jgi:RloB-like protein
MPQRREPARQPATRRVRRQVLVFSCGRRTEPAYLNGLQRGSDLAVALTVKHKAVEPHRLVLAASDFARRHPDQYDEVWCVVDVDDYDIGRAVRLAGQAGVQLALSNPCFELWLLLHHADCRAHCTGYDDVVSRLKKHVPTYDKSRLNFADYAAGVRGAVKRARDLDPTGADHRLNPSTSVWRLVERLTEQS